MAVNLLYVSIKFETRPYSLHLLANCESDAAVTPSRRSPSRNSHSLCGCYGVGMPVTGSTSRSFPPREIALRGSYWAVSRECVTKAYRIDGMYGSLLKL